MIDRKKRANQKKLNEMVNRAVQKSTLPGAPTYATASSSITGARAIYPTIEGNFTEPDEDNETIHGFMLGVDTLGQENARLRVKGEGNRYYAYRPAG